MAVLSVLLVAIGSAIVMAAHAVPAGDDPAIRRTGAARVAGRIAADLHQARYVTERGANAVTLTVADRDGDGSPEVIRYAWSGTPGDPLTRRYNHGEATAVVGGVEDFGLVYDRRTVTEEYPGALVEGEEEVLSSYDPSSLLGAILGLISDPYEDVPIQRELWGGQYFQPALPSDTAAWRVTRAYFRAKESGSTNGRTLVQLRPAAADGTPTDTVLEEEVMEEADLGNGYAWREFRFDHVAGLDPREHPDLCLVLQHDGGSTAAEIHADLEGGSGGVATFDDGETWETDGDLGGYVSMIYYIYGTVSTRGPPQYAHRDYLTAARMTLQTSDDPASRLETSIHLPNTPEALSAVYEADFKSDPTRHDTYGDGAFDWVRRDGQPFHTASLVGGVWEADAVLESYPDNDFTELTTIDVRFRATGSGSGSGGAEFRIHADSSGGERFVLYAVLEPHSGGQALTVYRETDGAADEPFVTAPDLPEGFVDLRLLIDPGLDTVNVRVNGLDYDTHRYETLAAGAGGGRGIASIRSLSGTGEFDHVSIRVGGGE